MASNKWIQMAILALFATIGGAVLVNSLFNAEKVPVPGDRAPQFEVRTLQGETTSLSDYAGKWVLLNFWATYCLPCREEMPALNNQYNQHQDNGLVVLGVNMNESQVTVSGFLRQVPVDFPILLDRGLKIRKLYGVNELPTTVLISPEGRVERILIGMLSEPFMENMWANTLLRGEASR